MTLHLNLFIFVKKYTIGHSYFQTGCQSVSKKSRKLFWSCPSPEAPALGQPPLRAQTCCSLGWGWDLEHLGSKLLNWAVKKTGFSTEPLLCSVLFLEEVSRARMKVPLLCLKSSPPIFFPWRFSDLQHRGGVPTWLIHLPPSFGPFPASGKHPSFTDH